MNRKHFTAWLLALLVMLAALPVRQVAAAEVFSYDFQKTLKPWLARSTHDQCINSKTLRLALDDGLGLNINQYAALTSTCGSDTFMVATLQTEATSFTVQFEAKRIAGCEGCIPLLYVGPEPPVYPGQFTADFTAIGDKWQSFKYAVDLTSDTNGKVIVALVFANLDLGSGNGQSATIGFDNVQITPALNKCPACDQR